MIPWRRKWQPTPVLLPGKSHGWRISLHIYIYTAKSLQSYPTLCDPIDSSPPGFYIPRILQARILEWVAISFSRGSSQLRDQTWVSCIVDRCFTIWATREVHIYMCVCVCVCVYTHTLTHTLSLSLSLWAYILSPTLPICPTLPFPFCVYMSLLHICILFLCLILKIPSVWFTKSMAGLVSLNIRIC